MLNWLSSIGNIAPQIEHVDASTAEHHASTAEEENKQEDGHKGLPSTTTSELNSAVTNKEKVSDGKVNAPTSSSIGCVIEKESNLNERETDLTNVGHAEEENDDKPTVENSESGAVDGKSEVKFDEIERETDKDEGKNDETELDNREAGGKNDIVEGEESGDNESAISNTETDKDGGKNDETESENRKAEGKKNIVEGEESGGYENAISITAKECASPVEESTMNSIANIIGEGREDRESAKSLDEQEEVEKFEVISESPNDEAGKEVTESSCIQEGSLGSFCQPKGGDKGVDKSEVKAEIDGHELPNDGGDKEIDKTEVKAEICGNELPNDGGDKEIDKTEVKAEMDGNESPNDGKEITVEAGQHLGEKKSSAMRSHLDSESEDPDYSTSGIEGNTGDRCKTGDVQDRLKGDIEEKQQGDGNGEARMVNDTSERLFAANAVKEEQPTEEAVHGQKAKAVIADDSGNNIGDSLVESKKVKKRAEVFEESTCGSLDSTAGTNAILESRSLSDDVVESHVTVAGGEESNSTLENNVAEDEGIAVGNAERKRINRQHHLMKEIVKIQQERDAYEKKVQATGQKTTLDTSQPKEEVADSEAKQDFTASALGAAINFVKDTHSRDTQRKRSHGNSETSHDRGVTRGLSDREGKGHGRGMSGARPSLSATAPSHGGRINRLDAGDRRNKVRPKEKPVDDSGGFMRGTEKNSQKRAVDSRVKMPYTAAGTGSKAVPFVSHFDSTPTANISKEILPADNRGSHVEESHFGNSRSGHCAKKSVHDHHFGEKETVSGNLNVGLKITFDTASSERRIELAGSPSVGVSYGHVPSFTPPSASTFIPGKGGESKPSGNFFGGQSFSGRGPLKAEVGANPDRGWAGKWPPSPHPLHATAGNEAGLFESGVNRRQVNNGGAEREANSQPPSNSAFRTNHNFEGGAVQNSRVPVAGDRWQKGNINDVRSGNKQLGRDEGAGEVSRPFGAFKTGSEHGRTGPHKASVQNIGSQVIGGNSSRTTPVNHVSGPPSVSGLSPPVNVTFARSFPVGTGGRRVDDGPSSFLGERKAGTDRGRRHQEPSSQRGVISNVSTQDWRSSERGKADQETAGNNLQQESPFVSDSYGSRPEGSSSFNGEHSGYLSRGSDSRFIEEINNRGRDFPQRQDAKVKDEHGSGRKSVFERLGIPVSSGHGSGLGRGKQYVNPVPLREGAPPLGGGGFAAGRGGQQATPKPASGGGNGIGRGQQQFPPTQLREGPLGGGNGFGRGGHQADPIPAREALFAQGGENGMGRVVQQQVIPIPAREGPLLAGGNGVGRVQQQGGSQFSSDSETQFSGPDADTMSQPLSFTGFAGGTNAIQRRQFAAGRGHVVGRGRSKRNFPRAVEGEGFREEKSPSQQAGVRTGPSSDEGASKSTAARKETSEELGNNLSVVTSEVNITSNRQVDPVKGSSLLSRPESRAEVDPVVLQAYGDPKTRRSNVELYIPRRGTTEPVP